MKTEAAILVETSKPLELVELALPAVRPGQALVEIAFSGICHTQLLEVRGERGPDPFLPHCLGHEATGRVLEIGAGVTKIKPGDEVVLSWIKGSGGNVAGSVYRWGERDVNAGAVTTFQRHAVVSENRIVPLPAGLDLRDAVLLGCALPTGVGAVVNAGAARAGESLAVFGCGGIGSCAILGGIAAGCAPIFAVDPNPLKRELALALGASEAIDPGQGDPVAAIRSRIPGGVDLAVEATGIDSVMRQALDAVRSQGGRAVVVGNAPHGRLLAIDPRAFNDGKSLLGCWGGDSVPERDVPRLARLLRSQRIRVAPLLSDSYALEDVNRAMDDLAAGRVGRPLIDTTIR